MEAPLCQITKSFLQEQFQLMITAKQQNQSRSLEQLCQFLVTTFPVFVPVFDANGVVDVSVPSHLQGEKKFHGREFEGIWLRKSKVLLNMGDMRARCSFCGLGIDEHIEVRSSQSSLPATAPNTPLTTGAQAQFHPPAMVGRGDRASTTTDFFLPASFNYAHRMHNYPPQHQGEEHPAYPTQHTADDAQLTPQASSVFSFHPESNASGVHPYVPLVALSLPPPLPSMIRHRAQQGTGTPPPLAATQEDRVDAPGEPFLSVSQRQPNQSNAAAGSQQQRATPQREDDAQPARKAHRIECPEPKTETKNPSAMRKERLETHLEEKKKRLNQLLHKASTDESATTCEPPLLVRIDLAQAFLNTLRIKALLRMTNREECIQYLRARGIKVEVKEKEVILSRSGPLPIRIRRRPRNQDENCCPTADGSQQSTLLLARLNGVQTQKIDVSDAAPKENEVDAGTKESEME